MTDITTKHVPLAPGDIPIKFKDLGDGTFAQYLALEPASIGGGGGGGLTDAQLRASRVPVDGSGVTQPVSGTFWQATQPVSIAALPALAAGSATIGKVDQGVGGASAWKVDGSAVTQPVSGTFYQATQPVSIASALDLSDRAARLVGVVSGGANIFHADSAGATVLTSAATDISILNADLIPQTDVTAYKWVNIQLALTSGAFAGATISWQGSNDGTTYSNLGLVALGAVAQALASNATAAAQVHGPLDCRYLRVRVTVAGGPGTVTATVVLHYFAGAMQQMTVAASGGVSDGAADGSTINPVKVGWKYNVAPPTYADGQRQNAQGDTRANLKVTLASRNTDTEVGIAANPLQVADASLAAILGTVADNPSAYSVLDQLARLRKNSDQELKALQALVAAAQPVPARKAQTTLLHRS